MIPADIQAYVLTYNEEENISRCLEAITWIPRVVVVDSFSTDKTKSIATSFKNVTFVERAFDNHINQHTFATQLVSSSKWVLRLDADWILSKELINEILKSEPDPSVGAFRARFLFSLYGQNVPISLYPAILFLYKPASNFYVQKSHTESLVPLESVIEFDGYITHDDRKPIDRFLESQIKYTKIEVDRFSRENFFDSILKFNKKAIKDNLRSLPGLVPIFVVLYLGVFRFGFFRNSASRHYILQRVIAEMILSLRILDNRLRNKLNP